MVRNKTISDKKANWTFLNCLWRSCYFYHENKPWRLTWSLSAAEGPRMSPLRGVGTAQDTGAAICCWGGYLRAIPGEPPLCSCLPRLAFIWLSTNAGLRPAWEMQALEGDWGSSLSWERPLQHVGQVTRAVRVFLLGRKSWFIRGDGYRLTVSSLWPWGKPWPSSSSYGRRWG